MKSQKSGKEMAQEMCDVLNSQAWQEFPHPLRKSPRCFAKRFKTPTRCQCNSEKDGMQVVVYVSHLDDFPQAPASASYEMEICGELPDGTWVNFSQYSLPKNINEGLKLIPRLLATWEFIANQTVASQQQHY